MNLSIVLLRWVIRLAGLAGLVLGIVIWSGSGYRYLQSHIWLGFIVTFSLLLLVLFALLSRVRPALPLLGLAWAVLLPVIGIAQLRIVLGPNHWTVRVLHLILGIGAIGFGEVLAKRALLRNRP